jgi:hypothetical protein
MVTVNDLYAFDANAQVSPKETRAADGLWK